MHISTKKLAAAAMAVAMTLAGGSAALASGGLDSGGSGGTSSGGGTGGGGTGGGTTTACSPVSSYTTSTGYVPYGLGTTYVAGSIALKGCGGGGGVYTTVFTETDTTGARADYVRTATVSLGGGKALSLAYSNLPLPNSTTFLVTFVVRDEAGNIVDSRSGLETTPKTRLA